jgi:hypothetical protein
MRSLLQVRFCISSVLSGTGAQRCFTAPETSVTSAVPADMHSSKSADAQRSSNSRVRLHRKSARPGAPPPGA